MFQLPWCSRQRPADIYAPAGIAMLNMMMMIGLGIYVLVVWSKFELCFPFDGDAFYRKDWNNYYDHWDDCDEELWGMLAFICALNWGVAAISMFKFVHSGRHAELEQKYDANIIVAYAQAINEQDVEQDNESDGVSVAVLATVESDRV